MTLKEMQTSPDVLDGNLLFLETKILFFALRKQNSFANGGTLRHFRGRRHALQPPNRLLHPLTSGQENFKFQGAFTQEKCIQESTLSAAQNPSKVWVPMKMHLDQFFS